MTSDAQIAANRRNAQKSTGPRTPAGKDVVRQNALKHGLVARKLICLDEKNSDFEEFALALRADLQPLGAVEEQLAERIILCSWRLRRVARAEGELIERRQDWEPARRFGQAFDRGALSLAALSRYETGLDRALQRAYLLLERLQARRRGEAVTPPLAVAIAGSAT